MWPETRGAAAAQRRWPGNSPSNCLRSIQRAFTQPQAPWAPSLPEEPLHEPLHPSPLASQRRTGYQVSYEYRGQQFSTVLPENPGPNLKVRVSIDPVVR